MIEFVSTPGEAAIKKAIADLQPFASPLPGLGTDAYRIFMGCRPYSRRHTEMSPNTRQALVDRGLVQFAVNGDFELTEHGVRLHRRETQRRRK